MITSKRYPCLLALITLTIFQATAINRLVIQSSHVGTPIDIQWHKKTGTLLSVGEDGRLIVTNPNTKKVIHRFSVTNDEIHLFQNDPSSDRVAIVTLREGKYSIAVWDWDEEKKIYEFPLDSEPLFVSWSARGQYLTVGRFNNPSIIIIDGKTGKRLSFLKSLPSLYNSGYIGETEKILMTYTTSGGIRYWDIRTSALKLSAKTESNLSHLTILQTGDKSILFARKGTTLFLINRITGTVLDSLVVPGLLDAAVDTSDGSLDVLRSSPFGARIQQYTTAGGNFLDRNFDTTEIPLNISSTPVGIIRGNGHTYIATDTSALFLLSGSKLSLIIDDTIWLPQALDFNGNHFYMSGNAQVWRLTSPFFSEVSNKNIADLVNHTSRLIEVGTPAGETGLAIIPSGKVITWDKDPEGLSRGIRITDFAHPESFQFIESGNNISQLKVLSSFRALTVDENGTIKIYDTQTGKIHTEFTALGLLDATYSPDGDFILVGRSTNNRTLSPLEIIDVRTRESLLVPDDRFMIYKTVAGINKIYTIGVVNKFANNKKTTLLAHSIKNPQLTQVLHQIQGEDFDAIVIPQPSGGGVYTTLGGEVQKILGSRKTTYHWNKPILNLHEHGSILYGIDSEGSLILWDVKKSTQAILQVHFFKGGSWIALQPGSDSIWASQGALEKIIFLRNGKEIDPKRLSNIHGDL